LHVSQHKFEDAEAINEVNTKLAIVESTNSFKHHFVPFLSVLHVVDAVWELLDKCVHPLGYVEIIDSRWFFIFLEILDGHTLFWHFQVDQNWLQRKLIVLLGVVVMGAKIIEVVTWWNQLFLGVEHMVELFLIASRQEITSMVAHLPFGSVRCVNIMACVCEEFFPVSKHLFRLEHVKQVTHDCVSGCPSVFTFEENGGHQFNDLLVFTIVERFQKRLSVSIPLKEWMLREM